MMICRNIVEAYTGCPPGRVIYAVLDEEYEESQGKRVKKTLATRYFLILIYIGCVTENDVPCFYFENDYKLHVLINDTILDYSEEFQIAGIRVVGGTLGHTCLQCRNLISVDKAALRLNQSGRTRKTKPWRILRRF